MRRWFRIKSVTTKGAVSVQAFFELRFHKI